MKRLTVMLIAGAAILAGGFAVGQEPGPGFEHLKPYGPMLGTWRYEGPLLEELPGIAEKGTPCVFQFSWRRILNRNVVMEDWSFEIKDGKKLSGKALIGWNFAEQRIVYGGMDSLGGMGLGTVVFDRRAKTSTLTSEGVSPTGNNTTFKGVVTKKDRDTLTWQALQQSGGIVEGPSHVYTFKRVPRAKRGKAAK